MNPASTVFPLLLCSLTIAGLATDRATAVAQGVGRVRVVVTSDGRPVPGALVTAAGVSASSDVTGTVRFDLPAGSVRVTVAKDDYFPASQEVVVRPGETTTATVDLTPVLEVEEEVVVVATTRTGGRLDDQPTRVEVLGQEEIEEKTFMTPGDIVMMLNETGGLRVQATSPSIGAASVRVQGMKGRYTRVFSDGLPLFGQQVGGLGLLQIPPMDLGQVEVIKGVASAFYGAGAMGGVVNLLARRPAAEPVREGLVNASTLGATDAVIYMASSTARHWSASLLAGGHGQARNDRDDDDWADVAGYARGVVRPRVFWDGGNGRSAFVTMGLTIEDRRGGTMPGKILAPTGGSFVESLDTRRVDIGATVQAVVRERFFVTARAAAARQRHDHGFGPVLERDRHATAFGELAVRGAAGTATWVTGLAYERDDFDPRDVAGAAYTFGTPGLFAQADAPLAAWAAVSAGARLDRHSEYGTFFSPRVSVLVTRGAWTSRGSIGQGFFAPTPLTEETEAAGLSRLSIPDRLDAERGTSASVDLTRTVGAGSITATLFGSRIADPVGVDRERRYALFNWREATANTGLELLAVLRRGPVSATSSYTHVRSREGDRVNRQDTELTPRHSAGVVAMWEAQQRGRVGLEIYYTGSQRLEANPFRTTSRPYTIVGLMVERRIGPARLFLNAENVTNVRQTRWDRLVRPTRAIDGRWTVDAWAPLDGRVFNGGLRVTF